MALNDLTPVFCWIVLQRLSISAGLVSSEAWTLVTARSSIACLLLTALAHNIFSKGLVGPCLHRTLLSPLNARRPSAVRRIPSIHAVANFPNLQNVTITVVMDRYILSAAATRFSSLTLIPNFTATFHQFVSSRVHHTIGYRGFMIQYIGI